MAKSVVQHTKSKANLHLERLRYLTPKAAEIGEDFLKDWLDITDRLNDLAQKEDIETLKAFPGIEWTYPYNRLLDLFKCFDKINVPAFR